MQSIHRLQKDNPKLAIVGCSAIDRWRLENVTGKRKSVNIPIRYFRDPEEAKTWLVSEGY